MISKYSILCGLDEVTKKKTATPYLRKSNIYIECNMHITFIINRSSEGI